MVVNRVGRSLDLLYLSSLQIEMLLYSQIVLLLQRYSPFDAYKCSLIQNLAN